MRPEPESRRIADIEMLRGVAILFVLVEHVRYNLFTWTSPALERISTNFGGWTGVDLFFVISGFVIARGLVPRLEEGRETGSFFNVAICFWVRRAWRLLPSAWLWLAVILVAGLTFNRSGAFGLFHTNFRSVMAALLGVADLRIVLFDGHESYGASFPYWSLSFEEQFYLLVPGLVLLSGRRLPIVLATLVGAQFFIDRYGPRAALFNVHSDTLLLGVLIALWSRQPSHGLFEPAPLARNPLAKAAVLLILLGALGALGANGPTGSFAGQDYMIPFRVAMIALLSAALVWIASYDGNYLCPGGAAGRVMLWIGSRSYSLYLIHIPVYFATREIWYRIEPPGTNFSSTYSLHFGLTALVLLITLTEMNYRLVETPLRRKGARIADRLATRIQQLRQVAEESEPTSLSAARIAR